MVEEGQPEHPGESYFVHTVQVAMNVETGCTAQLMVQHVCWADGLPFDMVSDCGPQFSSRFSKAFSPLIGSSASVSSGFHPQPNGQTERVNQEGHQKHRWTKSRSLDGRLVLRNVLIPGPRNMQSPGQTSS